jgi:hypothetical protein
MYKIIKTVVEDVEYYIVYNTVKKLEEARFSTNKEAMSYVMGR